MWVYIHTDEKIVVSILRNIARIRIKPWINEMDVSPLLPEIKENPVMNTFYATNCCYQQKSQRFPRKRNKKGICGAKAHNFYIFLLPRNYYVFFKLEYSIAPPCWIMMTHSYIKFTIKNWVNLSNSYRLRSSGIFVSVKTF